MELVLESPFVFLWFIQEKKNLILLLRSRWFVVGTTSRLRSQNTPHPHLHLPKINPSPQGSGLHRWVCSDTLVRLKSQAGFINSYSGSVDTPSCIVTNACINLLCPSVLQNYISSYMIKSDWLQSVSPLNLSEPKMRVLGEAAVNVVNVIRVTGYFSQTHESMMSAETE